MKNVLNIFFSWQLSSKTDKLNNKEFILSCIQKAANAVQGRGDLKDVVFKVKQGTGGEPGTPDMIVTCLKRNDECHIFIADISIDKKFNKVQRWANQKPDLRERPNENVMYELGRADGHLRHEQVIHVANTVFGDVCENDYLRPVDIRHKRYPITFCLAAQNAPEAEKVEKELIEDLKVAISKSAKAALKHIHDELLPYEDCEQVTKELGFKKKFVFNDNLRNIKKAISDNKGVLRVLGLNGIGKTRLVLETILAEQDDVPKLYCDCQISQEPDVIETSSKIFEKQVAAVLILDNCDEILFEKILRLYYRKKARNRLYSLFDNPAETQGIGYNVTRFNDAYEDVVDGIIARLYGKQDEVSTKIKEFASGNPLMTVQAIEGIENTGDIRDFSNQKLVSNLLSAPNGSDERIIAETLSLFSSIGYEGDAHKEIVTIALNKNITGLNHDGTVLVNKFDALIRLYLNRGLMQRVGVYVRFRSPAISKMLNDEWFAKCTATQVESIILTLRESGLADNLVPPFFDKIKDAVDNEKVSDLIKELLQPGKLLTKLEFLNTEVGSKIYRSLVEIEPDFVCDSLFHTLGGLGLDELKKIRDGRRELVWTLEKLCYKPETFEKAAKLMLRLGCSEVEHISNNATGQFISLFPVRLPATSVPLNTRLDFLKAEINSQEEKPLLMKALDRALWTTNFIRFGGDVIIGHKTYTFYDPYDLKEVEPYITGCLDLLQSEIDSKTDYSDACIKMMASNFRALNSFGLFDLIMPRVENVAEMLNYEWDDLLHVLHFARKDDETRVYAQHLQRVEQLIAKLSKTDFVSRFAQVESYECNDYWGLSDKEHSEIVNRKYEVLAEEMASQNLYNKELLKDIYQTQTFLPHAFAIKLASLNTPEEQLTFASDSIDLLEERANSIFVYYVKEVSEEVFARIVEVVYEKGKQWLMFSLVAVRNYNFDHPYVDKLFELVEQKVVDCSMFITYWNYVRIDRLSTPEAVGLLAKVISLPDSFVVALHMAMSQYLSSNNKHPEMDELFEKEMIKRADDVTTLVVYSYYSHILVTLLSNGERKELAQALVKGIFNHVISPEQISLRYEVEQVLQVMFEKYFEITWTEMAALMSAKDGDENFVKFYYAFGFSTIHNPFPALIFKKENLTMLIDWCKVYPKGSYMLMALAPLTEGDTLSEPVMMLLDNYGSDKLVRTALSDKLGTFSGPASIYNDRAGLIEPLTKHTNPEVSNWAVLEIGKLKQYGEQSQKIEESFMMPGRTPGHRWTLYDVEEEDEV